MNLLIQNYIEQIIKLSDKAISDGVPEFALLMALDRVKSIHLEPLVQAKMKQELEEFHRKARPGKPVTEDRKEG